MKHTRYPKSAALGGAGIVLLLASFTCSQLDVPFAVSIALLLFGIALLAVSRNAQLSERINVDSDANAKADGSASNRSAPTLSAGAVAIKAITFFTLLIGIPGIIIAVATGDPWAIPKYFAVGMAVGFFYVVVLAMIALRRARMK